MPAICSGNDGVYTCTGALSLADSDTIRGVSRRVRTPPQSNLQLVPIRTDCEASEGERELK